MALFENYEGRIEKITSVLNSYGIKDIEEAKKITGLPMQPPQSERDCRLSVFRARSQTTAR